MVNDAEKFKGEDDKQKERISAKNSLESYIFNLKSSVDNEEVKKKLSPEELSSARKFLTLSCSGWTAISWQRRRSSKTSRRRLRISGDLSSVNYTDREHLDLQLDLQRVAVQL